MEGEAAHNIDKLLVELKHVVQTKSKVNESDTTDIIQILDSLINVSKSCDEGTPEFTIDDVFLTLLTHESKTIIIKAAKTIAEIAKTEQGRNTCTNDDLVKILIKLLKEDDIHILTQTCRALGNICYENEKGKQLVQQRDSLKDILTVLTKSINLRDAEGAAFLRNVTAGFLLNFLIGQDDLQRKALEQNVLSIICSILEIDGTVAREAATHAMLILGILADLGQDILDERLIKVLVDILESDGSPEISEMCLELLHGQTENENTKLLLAKAGVCELLLKLLEKHGPRCTDEETRSVLKMACNLIVVILTGDESMNLLYDDSNGEVYEKLVEWLESSDEDLQITAVLAMGNFARTDIHCERMVAQGVHRKLLRLMSENNNRTCDIRLQHALLSALRNLVIPAANKPIVLADELIDIVYPMLDIPTFPVVFKLLGTLRIVIDGQQEAATSLGRRDGLIKKVVEWCSTEDHPGVQGEANRLIAWLIKNSRDKEVIESVIKHGAVKYLVKMLTAQHALMQNEAVISLTILATVSLLESEQLIIEAEIGQTMCKFLEQDGSNVELAMIYNALSLTESLIKSDAVKQHLQKAELPTAWRKLIRIREAENLKEKIEPLCILIEAEIN